MTPRPLVALAVVAATLAACGGGQPDSPITRQNTTVSAPSPTETSSSPTTTTTTPPAVTVLAAGDIAWCEGDGDERTAALLDARPDAVILILGDSAYPDGTPQQFADCFDPSWGRHRNRIRPSPGNHDFHTSGAAGYFGYYGDAAGDPGKGWYSFDHGGWHIVSVNSVCSVVACGPDSEQVAWLRADLEAHAGTRCTLAYWHFPRFSSGALHGSNPAVDTLWRTVHDGGVDVVLSGHEHQYERFARLDADGAPSEMGTRAFVAGTGGRSHYPNFADPPLPGSEVRTTGDFGVIELTLRPDGYDWQFVTVDGSVGDSGRDTCR